MYANIYHTIVYIEGGIDVIWKSGQVNYVNTFNETSKGVRNDRLHVHVAT